MLICNCAQVLLVYKMDFIDFRLIKKTKKLRILISLIFFFTTYFAVAQTTPIPDPNFEQQLIDSGIDGNGLNGNILNSDAESVTTLTTNRNDITNFEGLQAFVNLEKLNLGQNQFTTLPLANLNSLEELEFRENDALANLDLSNNNNLKKLDIRSPAGINRSSIRELDLSSNIKLEHIHIFNFQDLETIILPLTKTLNYLFILSNSDLTADLSFYDNLETLDLGVLRGKTINFSWPDVKESLKSIRILNGEVRDFRGLEDFINLEKISLFTIPDRIIFPNSTSLDFIQIHTHFFTEALSLITVPNLNFFDVRSNRSTIPLQVDLSSNTILETLVLIDNKMAVLNLETNSQLTSINVKENNLESLDLSENKELESVVAFENLLTNIDLRNCTKLWNLELSDNRLKSIDLSQNTDLVNLDISKNLFSDNAPDLSQNTELERLNMSNNNISTLDILSNLKLKEVDLSFNALSGNNILEQIVQNYQTAGRSLGEETYLLNDNLLSNTVPDFASLVDGSTTNFSISLQNNNFHFGDLEARHQQYVNFRNTPRGGGTIFKTYSYANQAKVNIREVITTEAGQQVTLATVVRGAQNHYTWFRDGVAIAGAADAPEYTIPSPEACESGVYHVEITSDLMPFENTNAPGTNGKNLVLLRNDLVLGANGVPSCALLIEPLNGSIDIPINSGIAWESESGACGFILNVGSTSGATDIVDNLDVGNVSAYNFQNNLPPNTEIFVTITPYFENGNLEGCREESFTTNNESTLPECSVLTQPLSGSVGVNPDTNISWSVASGAEGYRLKIGTSPGASDIANTNIEGGLTTYNPPNDFLLNSEIFVTVTPFNNEGDAIGCAESSFLVSEANGIPPCTTLSRPLNGDTEVSTSTIIRWNGVGNAVGYILNIGTTEFGSELLSRDVGSQIEFLSENNLPDNTTIYVTIIPYNTQGNAVACVSESFLTEELKPIPECTSLIEPLAGERDVDPQVDVVWNVSENAEGYILEVGTTPGGDDFFSEDVGLTTFYNFRNDLPEGRPIYVRITPYNERGEAISCTEESFITSVPIRPECTSLTLPENEETNVSVATNFAWNVASTATGYRLILSTISGGDDLFNEDVGATTFFDLPTSLPENTLIYVKVIPYNNEGEALDCQEEQFTTSEAISLPNCSNLTQPLDGAVEVGVNTPIAWAAVSNAEGYRLNIGTSSGGGDIFSGDVESANSFDITENLPENATVYVSILPYNDLGEALNCEEQSFSTASEPRIPECTSLTMPLNNATDVSIDTNVSWKPINNADGYVLDIGTTSGASDIFSADVGRTTWYDLPQSLPENTRIYVSIIVYNEEGTSIGCLEEQFETTSEPTLPSCTTILIPKNEDQMVNTSTPIAWGLVANAEGYLLNVGTSSQGTDIFSGDVGASTWYELPIDLPESTTIYVSVIPYNQLGNAINCNEESFITANAPTIPSCTILSFPLNGSKAVNPELTIEWIRIADVTGYRLSVGTAPGVFDLVNDIDVGNVNQYNFDGLLPLDSQIFIDIRPYNEVGINSSCNVASFTTANLPLDPVPRCTDIFEPINGQSNIALTTTIRWNEVSDADGYFLSLGTSEGESDILNQFDVGQVDSYEVSGLPAASVIYASINAYNQEGSPEGCSFSTFITVFDEENISDTKFALTPNGDGLNDFWRIDGIEDHDNVVRIFNRWGDEVFKVNNYNNLTNAFFGKANQQTSFGAGVLPTGTYFFDIQIDGEHEITPLRGYLILKR